MSKSDNARRQITSIHLDRYVDMKIRLRNALKIDSISHYNSHSSCNLGLFMETCIVNNKKTSSIISVNTVYLIGTRLIVLF